MSKLDHAVKTLQQSTPILMYTTPIDDSTTNAAWKYLIQEYQTVQQPLSRVLVSILNAIVTQQRTHYAITRSMTRQVVQSDPNWKNNQPGFSNEEWPTILKLLSITRIAVLVHKGEGRRPSVYSVGEEWLHLITSNGNARCQEADAVSFVQKNEIATLDHKTAHKADLKEKREK